MANQISKFFATQSRTSAPQAVADHLTKFWEPRMREQICAHWQQGGAGLDPIAKDAVDILSSK
ncbi:MAG: formate dehydrogenase subunit delta [Pseudaminobacter sp.]